eukprot:1157112-Pelagomonas_calceolata.AAC.2
MKRTHRGWKLEIDWEARHVLSKLRHNSSFKPEIHIHISETACRAFPALLTHPPRLSIVTTAKQENPIVDIPWFKLLHA